MFMREAARTTNYEQIYKEFETGGCVNMLEDLQAKHPDLSIASLAGDILTEICVDVEVVQCET